MRQLELNFYHVLLKINLVIQLSAYQKKLQIDWFYCFRTKRLYTKLPEKKLSEKIQTGMNHAKVFSKSIKKLIFSFFSQGKI